MANAWFVAGLTALAITGTGQAQEAAPAPPAAPVPLSAPIPYAAPKPPPSPTILASQSSSICVPSLVPDGARCIVAGASMVNDTLTWALYEVRAADGRHAVSVLLGPDADPARLRAVASLQAPAAALDRWSRSPYSAAAIIKHGGVEYVGMSLKGPDGPAAFSVHAIGAGGLTPVASARLPAEVEAKLAALSKPGCRITTYGLDWRTFRLRYGLMSDEGSCGTAFLDLAVVDGEVTVADALAIR